MTDNICKVAQLIDEGDDIWYDLYEVDSAEGGRVRVEVPRDVREPANVRKHLLKKGAEVSGLNEIRKELNLAIQAAAPVIRRAEAVGWRNDCFVAHRYVVGGSGDGAVLPPRVSRSTVNIDECGTLEEWQELIGSACFSTTMILSLCTPFAAALMRTLNCSSFGMVLVGPSRRGKSTAQLVASSVFGFGTEEHLPTPNATPAGLLETASRFNDCMFPINEFGALKGDKAKKYPALRAMTYELTGGQDTIRHSSWAKSSCSDFRILIVASSEVGPDEWAARAGDARDPGETARLFGVPILYGDNLTVFDSFPPMPSTAQPAWIEEQWTRLRTGLPHQRGVAHRRYLEALTANPEEFIKNAIYDAGEFCDTLKEHATSYINKDIIGKFAIVYAGGFAACDARVLPFHPDVIFDAVRRACLSALQLLPDPDADLRNDLRTLHDLLSAGSLLHVDEASKRQIQIMEKADGYIEKAALGCAYTLRTTFFTNAFPSLLRARRVLEWLDSEGNLRHQRARQSGVSTEWAQSQVTWPNDQRVRSFVLYFPAGLKVLEKA